jgi:hypothetical protein
MTKRLYYEQLLESNKLNCKKTWNILNEIINKRKQDHETSRIFRSKSV